LHTLNAQTNASKAFHICTSFLRIESFDFHIFEFLILGELLFQNILFVQFCILQVDLAEENQWAATGVGCLATTNSPQKATFTRLDWSLHYFDECHSILKFAFTGHEFSLRC
jgi:hypothetical protein